MGSSGRKTTTYKASEADGTMYMWLTTMYFVTGLTLSQCEFRVLMKPASNKTRTVSEHFTIWQAVRTPRYYIVGQRLEEYGLYPKLLMPVVTGVEGDDIATPIQMSQIFYSHTFLQVWRMKCPTGFGALGDLSTMWRAPNKELYRCVNKRHLIEAKPGIVMGYLRSKKQNESPLGFVRIEPSGGWNTSFYYAADHDLSTTNLVYTLKTKYMPSAGVKSLRTFLIVIAVLLPIFAVGLFIRIWKRYGSEFTDAHTRLESDTADDVTSRPHYIDMDTATNQDADESHVTHFYDQIKSPLPENSNDASKSVSLPTEVATSENSSENSYEQPIPQQQPVYFDLNAPYNKDL